MVLSRIICIVLLDFLAVATVFGWSHVSKNEFQSIINQNEVALVACRSSKQVLMSTRGVMTCENRIFSHFDLTLIILQFLRYASLYSYKSCDMWLMLILDLML